MPFTQCILPNRPPACALAAGEVKGACEFVERPKEQKDEGDNQPGTEEIFSCQVDSFSTGNCPRGLLEYRRGDLGKQKERSSAKCCFTAKIRQKSIAVRDQIAYLV